MLMVASSFQQKNELKGRPPQRSCPDDFDVIFVEQGRVECERWYRASRITVNRWMDERGPERLIDARAAYVSHMRKQGKWMTRSTNLVEHREIARPTVRQTIRDRRKVPILVARHAAQFLRVVRNGGFIVSPTNDGDWWVGTRRLSAAQMLDIARTKGFEDKVVIIEAEAVEHDRLVYHPERYGAGGTSPAVTAQRPDGSTYIPNASKRRKIRSDLQADGDEEVNR
jgi:hypothetical protein